MRRRISIFALVLSLLLILVYSYTSLRLSDVPALRALLAVPFALVWLIPIVYWGGRRESRAFADHLIQYLGFLSMGWVSFLLVATVIRDLVMTGARLAGATGVVASLAVRGDNAVLVTALVAFLLGGLHAMRGPRIAKAEVVIEGLPRALDGLRIAQISDLHVGPTIKKRYVERVAALVNGLDADLVAVTGDIVDGPVAALAPDVAPLGGMLPKEHIYFCTGNHEYYADAPAWLAHFRGLGFHTLENAHTALAKGGARVQVAGIVDPAVRMGGGAMQPDPEAAAAQGPLAEGADLRILLAHNPKIAPAAAAAGFDLMLSGHTHAGQFFPWTIVTRIVHAPHFAGLSREGKMAVYVSAGTGWWGPPFRLGTRAEVSLIVVRRGSAA